MHDPLARLSVAELTALRVAGDELARIEAGLLRSGTSPLVLLTGGGPTSEFRHYPPGDVYDFDSHSQFYYHTHRGGEHGHAHLFLRPKGMPPGLRPLGPADEDAPCHLVAVDLGADGWLDGLFTTNRWVTGEAWYSAEAVKAMLPCFSVDADGPSGLAGRWLTAVLHLFRPLVAELADRRDAAVATWNRAHPADDPLEDPNLEITSRAKVSVETWRAAVHKALAP